MFTRILCSQSFLYTYTYIWTLNTFAKHTAYTNFNETVFASLWSCIRHPETDKSNKTLNMFKHHLFHSVSLCRIKQSIINFDLIVIYSLSNMSCMVFHNVSNEPWNVNQYIYETPCIVVKHTCESYTFPSSIYSRHKLLITVVHMLQVFGKTWLILLRWLVNYILFKDIV